MCPLTFVSGGVILRLKCQRLNQVMRLQRAVQKMHERFKIDVTGSYKTKEQNGTTTEKLISMLYSNVANSAVNFQS